MTGETPHFDEVAAEYDDVFPPHITAHYLRKRVRLIRLFLAGGRGLDVGCGTGRLIEALKPFGNVIGVDSSAGMLKIAREQRHCDVTQANSDDLPFADGSFDVVFSVAMLHHVADPERVRRTISEMARVTRRDGRIIIWDHNPRNPFWPGIMKRAPQDTGEERLISAAEILNALKESNVQRITAFQSGFMPPFMPRWLTGIAGAFEMLFEHTPFLRRVAAHNVVIARK